MIAKLIIEAPVNEMVRDWIDELGGLIKYTNYPHSDFLVDIQASKELNGLDDLLTLINANCEETYTMSELLNCQYVHVMLPPAYVSSSIDRTDKSSEIVKAWLQDNVSDELLDILANNVGSDIWYDAAAYGDTETLRVIEETQEAMSEISRVISEIKDS